MRWINREVKPLPNAARWIVVLARYPVLLLILAAVPATLAVLLVLGYGDLAPFLAFRHVPRPVLIACLAFVAAAGLYGFWFYALSRPRR